MMRMVMRMRRMMMVVFVVVIVLKKSVIARVYMRVTMCGIIAMEMRMLVHIFLYMIVILAVMAMRDFLHMRMRMHVMVMFVVVLMYMVMFMFVVVLMRMVMVMLMRMPTWHSPFLLAMNQHPHMRTGNAALCARLCFKNHTRYSHGIQFGKRGFLIRHQFQESRGQHIARRPHRAFDI